MAREQIEVELSKAIFYLLFASVPTLVVFLLLDLFFYFPNPVKLLVAGLVVVPILLAFLCSIFFRGSHSSPDSSVSSSA